MTGMPLVRGRSTALALALALTSCTGTMGPSGARQDDLPPGAAPPRGGTGMGAGSMGSGAGSPTGPAGPSDVGAIARGASAVHFASAARRLTRAELRQTVLDLLGVDLAAEIGKLPEDFSEAGDVFAFDNKYTLQQPSAALVAATKEIAETVAARVQADPAVRARILPCMPTGAGDAACLKSFVAAFGRRALRRPLAPDEVDAYVARFAPLAMEANDFNRGVGLAVRALLQDLEFLYRVEAGTPVAGSPGLLKLGGYEVASRLSYFLWGTTPDDALLAAAGSGAALGTPAAVREAAARMLEDPRARRGIDRFFGLWLGWERTAPQAPFSDAMRTETSSLLSRVLVEEKRPWSDLFRAKETYVDGALAAHYGLPAPAGGKGAWVPYGATGRQGILSHGAFLGVERKHEDTSPTMRGHFIRTRVLCQPVPDPPPGVDTDEVPAAGTCKADRYDMWKRAGCNGCHLQMDPIGHGLEAYDRVGKARTVAPGDAGKANCQIAGAGELQLPEGGGGRFEGVAGLSDKLADSGAMEACLVTQLSHLYLGREVRDEERAVVADLTTRLRANGRRFDQLLLDFVSLPGFGYRLAE